MLIREVAKEDSLHLFEVGEGGNGAQVIVEHNTVLPQGRQGYGTVHHTAFRVEETTELHEWKKRIKSFGYSTSGYIDRFFFESYIPALHLEYYSNGQQMVQDLWVMSPMKQ